MIVLVNRQMTVKIADGSDYVAIIIRKSVHETMQAGILCIDSAISIGERPQGINYWGPPSWKNNNSNRYYSLIIAI
jgi:hypothetical protein